MQLKSHSVGLLLPTWHPKKGKENKHLSPANSRPLPLRQKLTVLFWQFVTAVSTLPETDTKSDKKKASRFRTETQGTSTGELSRVLTSPHLTKTSRRRDPGHRRAPTATIPAPSTRGGSKQTCEARTTKGKRLRRAYIEPHPRKKMHGRVGRRSPEDGRISSAGGAEAGRRAGSGGGATVRETGRARGVRVSLGWVGIYIYAPVC
jgi:hypothetical protein